jgi:molybdopterin/thiamine biosynthesis adenylyltransferase
MITHQYNPLIYKSFQDFENKYLNINPSASNYRLMDTLEEQVRDLVKLKNPERAKDNLFLNQKIEEFFQKNPREEYGNWVYYPWRNTLVRLLPEKDFIAVRTVRNKNKITQLEQDVLRKKKIGVVGLSVGQSVASTMAMERIGGELRIADFDFLELSNLNRIRAGVMDIGDLKTDITAKQIVEIDPYLIVKTFDQGVTKENIEEFIGKDEDQLDLIIDECDAVEIKVLLRIFAKQKRIPVLMDTSDRGMLDVERYDEDPGYPLFHGLINDKDIKALLKGDLSNQDILGIVMKILNKNTMSNRLSSSILEIGKTLSTWPQLASAVVLGGGSAAIAARKILLNDPVKSGRYFVDVDEVLQGER